MEAPDKIYIEQKAVMYDMVNTEPCKPDDYEYIRKDALLEFLVSLEKDSARNTGTNDLAYAAHEMVCELIDKLERI